MAHTVVLAARSASACVGMTILVTHGFHAELVRGIAPVVLVMVTPRVDRVPAVALVTLVAEDTAALAE